MPQEKRKRGARGKKKRKKEKEETTETVTDGGAHSSFQPLHFSSESAVQAQFGQAATEAPFGYLDASLKAYLKSLEPKLAEQVEEHDHNAGEDSALLLEAALSEVRGRELVISTDPDGSIIIQRIFNLLDERQSRIFADALVGSVLPLAKHRFGSHVLQDVIRRLGQNETPSQDHTEDEAGENAIGILRSAQELYAALGQELVLQASLLVSEQFGTHVLRTFIAILLPESHRMGSDDSSHLERSRRSRKFIRETKIQAAMQHRDLGNGFDQAFRDGLLTDLMREVERQVTDVEIRAWTGSPSASPTFQYFLEAESYLAAKDGGPSRPLLLRFFDGMIDMSQPISLGRHSDFIEGVLRDTTGSRTLQVALRKIRDLHGGLNSFYRLYLQNRLVKLACHPIANFVVQEFLTLLDQDSLQLWSSSWADLKFSLARFIKAGRPGLLRAIIQASLNCQTSVEDCQEVKSLIISLFAESEQDPKLSWNVVTLTLDKGQRTQEETDLPQSEERAIRAAPSLQGSLLFQSLLDLPEPEPLVENIAHLGTELLEILALDPQSSHLFDKIFTSESVPRSNRRHCILAMSSLWPTLARHNVGSRVLEKMWSCSDIALRERIARTLTSNQGRPGSSSLESDFYGKWIVKNFDLTNFKKKIAIWRERQINSLYKTGEAKRDHSGLTESPTKVEADYKPAKKVPKRKLDEIDDLFASKA